MSLKLNESRHWQLPNGAELRSGDQVEMYQDERWIPGEISYHPRRDYQIQLDNGQIFDLSEQLTLRIQTPEWDRQKRVKEI